MGYQQHYLSQLCKKSQKILSHIKLDITIMLLGKYKIKSIGNGNFHVLRENTTSYFIINKEMLLYYLWNVNSEYDFTTPVPENHRLYVNRLTELELTELLINALFNYHT